MKVSELSGAQLDYWVAKACGYGAEVSGISGCVILTSNVPAELINNDSLWNFSPSTNWQQCGPLIEEHKLEIGYDEDEWFACEYNVNTKSWSWGATPLIAACRCIVASKYGDEVRDA